MPKNNKRNSIHAQRLKAIRPYVNFDFDLRSELTAHQKRKIKQYFDEIDALTARPYQVYKPKTKQRLKKAQEFAQHEKHLPGLKVAFIPNNGKDRAKIRFNKAGDIVATTDHVSTRVLSLDTAELIKDPIGHINKVIKKDPAAKRFTALCGRYEIPVSQSRATIGRFVANLTAKYSSEDANNFHGNWLHGIAAHHFTNQADYTDYMREKQASKRKVQKDRKLAKRRAKYAASKKRK
ncbi:hypothetical protein VPHD526_0022 [Vibrio phage D526]